MNDDIEKLTALELAAAIKNKKISVFDAVSAYIDKIEKNDKQFNTFISISKESALARAKEIQSRIDNNDTLSLSPLAGVPVALKDNIFTKEMETTCASRMLNGYKSVFDAAVVEKLENAGMIVIGKLNMDEFAIGSTGRTGFFGVVRNPWDAVNDNRITCSNCAAGSNYTADSDCTTSYKQTADKNISAGNVCVAGDGSAAAIAAGETPIALGTDTGGGIRQPCSFCGVTGIKPTYGSVSRYGIAAYASSLDQAGPVGQDINDCAALLSIISGPDKRDSTCIIKKPFEFSDEKAGMNACEYSDSIKGVKIGIPVNYLCGKIDEDIKNSVLAAAKEYEAAGAIIEEFEMPLMDYILPVYNIISSAEASSNLAKFDGLKYGYRSTNSKTLSDVYRLSRSEGFGLEVKRKIMLGSFVLSSGNYDVYYKKALQARTLIINAYNKLFEQFDCILSPVTPTTACMSGEIMDMYMGDIYTASVNLSGLPAVSLPCGFDRFGLPIGFQIIGGVFSESKLIDTARVYQKRTDFHRKKPGGKISHI